MAVATQTLPVRIERSLTRFCGAAVLCVILCLVVAVTAGCTPDAVQSLLLPEQEQYLASLPDIRLAPDPDYPPIDFFDKSGRHTGLSADYIKRIERCIGRSFRVVRAGNFDEILEMARRKQVDVICTAQKNSRRSEYLLFTKPVVDVSNVIIVNTAIKRKLTLNDLKGLRVRLVKGHTVERWIARDYPELSYATVDNTLEGLIAVSFGLADAIVAELPTASYLIGKNGLANLKVAADTGYRYQLRIGIRKDMPELHRILDKALATITERYCSYRPESPGSVIVLTTTA